MSVVPIEEPETADDRASRTGAVDAPWGVAETLLAATPVKLVAEDMGLALRAIPERKRRPGFTLHLESFDSGNRNNLCSAWA
jgi:hypothetical protein